MLSISSLDRGPRGGSSVAGAEARPRARSTLSSARSRRSCCAAEARRDSTAKLTKQSSSFAIIASAPGASWMRRCSASANGRPGLPISSSARTSKLPAWFEKRKLVHKSPSAGGEMRPELSACATAFGSIGAWSSAFSIDPSRRAKCARWLPCSIAASSSERLRLRSSRPRSQPNQSRRAASSRRALPSPRPSNSKESRHTRALLRRLRKTALGQVSSVLSPTLRKCVLSACSGT